MTRLTQISILIITGTILSTACARVQCPPVTTPTPEAPTVSPAAQAQAPALLTRSCPRR